MSRGRDAHGLHVDHQRSLPAGFDAHPVEPVDIGRLEALIRSLTRVAPA